MSTTDQKMSTRDRILDVALDLFIEKGYDKVSLREVAERVGVTKAALYYHFASKDEIFRTLVDPLLSFGAPFAELLKERPTRESWARGWRLFLEWILAHRKLFALLQANQGKVHDLGEGLHDSEQHLAMHERFDALMTDESLSLDDRLRMASCIGVVGAVLGFPGGAVTDLSSEELLPVLQGIIDDILQLH
jgi:AcrR family transcriptional regulator